MINIKEVEPAMEKRISLITLGVRDIKVSRKFYETLGFEASPMSDDKIVFFQLLGMVLGLYPLKNLLEDTKLTDQTPVAGGITLGYNTRRKEEVDEILESVISAGVKVIAPATETPWGAWTGYFTDPDGHPWEASYVPQFIPGPDGSLNLPTDDSEN